MKQRIISYVFDASEKTITAGLLSTVGLAGIQVITNVTDGIIIYNFADSAKGGTLVGTVLTLEYNTTSMSDSDELMILVEDGASEATAAKQDTIIGHVDGIEAALTSMAAELAQKTEPADQQHVVVDSGAGLTDTQLRATPVPVSGTLSVSGGATAANQATEIAALGSLTETAPATDTASSGLNGRLQRLAQRFTTLFTLLPGSLGQKAKAASFAVTLASDQDALSVTDGGGSLTVDGAVTVSGTVAATQSGTWTEANSATRLSESDFDTKTGALTETAPASDTASSGLNGRLQRVAQHLTSILARIPAALTSGGGFKAGLVDALPAGTNNIGDVDIASIAAGDNNIGNVDIVTLPALVASSAIIGNVRIDQTTPGTTNGVQINAALPAGTNAIGKLAANSGVDIGDVDVTRVTPGVAATDLGKAVDSAAGSTDTVVAVGAVRVDTPGTLVQANGDYVRLQTDEQGALRVNPGALNSAVDSVTEVNSQDIAERMAVVEGWEESTRVKNNPIVGQAGVAAGAGAVGPTVQRVTHASDDPVTTSVQLIDDTIVADDAAFTPGTTKVNMAGFQADESSTDSVDEGDAGAARMTLDRKQIVNAQPHSAGGLSIHRSIDLDEGTLEVVKNSPGCVYGMWVTNQATTTRWIKFYDATSGTAGTGTPVITIGIPGNATDEISGAFGPGGVGIQFATGICVGAVTGVADNDTGAPSANDVIVNIFFK